MIEKDLKRLEEISALLDKGVNLDESLKLYEEGCKLAKNCIKELEKAKGKIVMIKEKMEKSNTGDDENEQE